MKIYGNGTNSERKMNFLLDADAANEDLESTVS